MGEWYPPFMGNNVNKIQKKIAKVEIKIAKLQEYKSALQNRLKK